MEIRICFSKRTVWQLRRIWRWILRTVPGVMELIGAALVLVGGIVVFGEGGNFECGELVHVSVLIGGAMAVVIGCGLLWAVHEIDEALEEDMRRKRRRMERYRR